MKKVLRLFSIIMILFIATGCSENYNKISYREFLGEFNDMKGYSIVDKTLPSEGIYYRNYEAGNGKYTFNFIEFKNKKEAKEYIKTKFLHDKKFSNKIDGDVIVLKTKFNDYIKIVRNEEIVIIGQGKGYFDRFKINEIMKKLGA